MTTGHDRVAGAINDFLDYLDEGVQGEPRASDHLDFDQRREAQAAIDSIAAGRRLDPTISPSSLERLLVDTPFYAPLVGGPSALDDAAEVRLHLETLYPWNVNVRVDEASSTAVPSRLGLVIVVNGQ